MSRNITLLAPPDGQVNVPIQPLLMWAISPTAPTNLQVSPSSLTSFTLTWNAVVGATSYQIYLEDEPLTPVTGLTYTFYSLEPNLPYNLGVAAVNESGESAISFITGYVTGVSGFRVISQTDTDVTLGWYELPEASSYRLWSTEASYDQTLSSEITEITLPVVAGTSYTFRITATVAGVPTLANILTLAQPLASVTNFVASNITVSSFNLSWSAVSGADGYRLWDTLSGYEEIFGAGTLTKSFSALPPNASFSFRIVARQGTSESAPTSLTVTTSVWNPALSPYITNNTGTSVTLNWANVSADSYNVYKKLNPADLNYVYIATVTGTAYTFSGLSYSTLYALGVNATKGSSYTTTNGIQVTTAAYVPPEPEISATEITASSFRVNWTAFNDADSYDVFNGGIQVGSFIYPPNLTFVVQNGLSPNVTYFVTVKARQSGIGYVGIDKTISVTTAAA